MMDKDYDKIKKLFEEALPELSSDESFISRVDIGIQGIDLVKSSLKGYKKRNMITAIFAGLTGFLCGALLTLIYPLINTLIQTGLLSYMKISEAVETIAIIATSVIITLVSLGVSLGTYSVFSLHTSILRKSI